MGSLGPNPIPMKREYSSVNLESTSPSSTPPVDLSSSIKFNEFGGFGSSSISGNEPIKYKKNLRTRNLAITAVIIFFMIVLGKFNVFSVKIPSILRTKPSLLSTPSHPIIPLIKSANSKWSSLLQSQSNSYEKSVRVYKQKYSLPVPVGFDKWFQFAKSKNHTLIDEYDSLMTDLSPFRSLSPTELRRRIKELSTISGISIISIRNGVSQVHSKSGKWAPALAFQEMIAGFVSELPDMDVAINEKPEGRVLPRRERSIVRSKYKMPELEVEYMNMTDPMINPTLAGFKPEWQRDGSVWEAFRRSCPTDSPSRRLVESIRSAETGFGLPIQGKTSRESASLTRRIQSGVSIPPTRELSFSKELDGNFNICDRPSLHSLHSTFFSDQRSIEYLYPVFSASKPTGFADILIPSNHYWSPSSETTYEADLKRSGPNGRATDMEWKYKKSSIFWRGKVTRGADTPPGHAGSFQKQRLVKMANAPSPMDKILVAFDSKTSSLTSTSLPITTINKALMDIAMACDPSLGECAYLRSLGYRVEPPGPLSTAWGYKFVLDLDEIGFSNKFLALMESKSVVVKSSMQLEFWKGWIVPWKHYIPLSSSYSELYNLLTFFSGFPTTPNSTTILTRPNNLEELPLNANGEPWSNDEAGNDIAQAGRDWVKEHLRKEDMECYVYRLMLEWAAMSTAQVEV